MSLILDALRKARNLAGGGPPQKAPAYLKSFGFTNKKPGSAGLLRKVLVSYVVPVLVLGSIIAAGVVVYINQISTSSMQVELTDPADAGLRDGAVPPLADPESDAAILIDADGAVEPGTPGEEETEAAETGLPAAGVEPEAPGAAIPEDAAVRNAAPPLNQPFAPAGSGDSATEVSPAEAEPAEVPDQEARSVEPPPGTATNATPPELNTTGALEAAQGEDPAGAPRPEPEPATLESTAPRAAVTPAASGPFELALFYQRSGERLRALDYYDQVLDVNPMHAEALYNVGVIHMGANDNIEAMRYFRQAAAADPAYDAPHNNMGTILMSEGRDQEATQEFTRALAINSRNAAARVNLAVLSRRAGDLDAAKTHNLLALQIDPDRAEAHFNLAVIYEEQGETGAAVDHLRRFLETGASQYPQMIADIEARIRTLTRTEP